MAHLIDFSCAPARLVGCRLVSLQGLFHESVGTGRFVLQAIGVAVVAAVDLHRLLAPTDPGDLSEIEAPGGSSDQSANNLDQNGSDGDGIPGGDSSGGPGSGDGPGGDGPGGASGAGSGGSGLTEPSGLDIPGTDSLVPTPPGAGGGD